MSITGGALTILNEFSAPPQGPAKLTGHECAELVPPAAQGVLKGAVDDESLGVGVGIRIRIEGKPPRSLRRHPDLPTLTQPNSLL